MKNNRDYLTMIIAVIAIILGAYSIMSNDTSSTLKSDVGNTLEKIRIEHVIDVCYAEYRPAVIKDPNTGNLTGHSIDTIEYIAEKIGATIRYHETTWGGAVADVATQRCDVMLTYFNQIERSFSIAFTDPMIYVGNSALINADAEEFKSYTDILQFDKEGITIAVANGEAGHNFVKENFKHAEIIVIDVEAGDLLKFLSLVQTGRADVGIADSVSISLYQREHSETTDLFASNPFSINPTAFGVRQDDIMFLNFLNDALLTMEVKGKIEEFEQKYDAHWIHLERNYRVS